MTTIKELLIAARSLIADREHWCTEYHATENTGAPVNPHFPEAYCFCADGALIKACKVPVSPFNGKVHTNAEYDKCSEALDLACEELFPNEHATLVDLNDGTTGLPDFISEDEALILQHANVLLVFDLAIAES